MPRGHRVPYPFVSDTSDRLRDELYRNFEDLSANLGGNTGSAYDALVRAYDEDGNDQVADISDNVPIFPRVFEAIAYCVDILGVGMPRIGILGDDLIQETGDYGGGFCSFATVKSASFGADVASIAPYTAFGLGGDSGYFGDQPTWYLAGFGSLGNLVNIFADGVNVDGGSDSGTAFDGFGGFYIKEGYINHDDMAANTTDIAVVALRANVQINTTNATNGIQALDSQVTYAFGPSTLTTDGRLFMHGGQLFFNDQNGGFPAKTLTYTAPSLILHDVLFAPMRGTEIEDFVDDGDRLTFVLPNVTFVHVILSTPQMNEPANNNGIALNITSTDLEHLYVAGHLANIQMAQGTIIRPAHIDLWVNEPSVIYGPANLNLTYGWSAGTDGLAGGAEAVTLSGTGIVGQVSIHQPEESNATATLLALVGASLVNLDVNLHNTGGSSTGPKGYAIDAGTSNSILRLEGAADFPVASTNASATTLVYDHNGDPSVAAHIADTSDAHDASAISYAGGTGITSTDVEAAIDELANERARSRKNSTGTVFERSQFNFIEGSNVTITMADDAGNNEVDITIAASGGGGSGLTHPEVMARASLVP